METLVYYLPALACVGGMALCVFMMSRSHSRSGQSSGQAPTTTAPGSDAEVAGLRAEVDALRAELETRDTTGAPASS